MTPSPNKAVVFLALVALLRLSEPAAAKAEETEQGCQVIVLGIAQDAGFPQAGCKKDCCRAAWADPDLRRFASSIAVVDHQSGQRWLLDCSPDFREQLRLLDEIAPAQADGVGLSGIFLTHAHVGHYAGLIHLGREAIGADSVDVYAMPRMSKFLQSNGPWDQLVKLKNISLQPLAENTTVKLNERISITPIQVPHRDEYSETVGFVVEGPKRKLLYLPDIDKWSRWDQAINDWVERVDVSLLDGTFFANGEIAGRDMSQIPHPFVRESIQQFSDLTPETRKTIRFIHLNHTNPAIDPNSRQRELLRRAEMDVVDQGQIFDL